MKATAINLSKSDQATLASWVRTGTMEHRMVMRAKIVLAACEGRTTQEIAQSLGTRTATVSKWRNRFARSGLTALRDAPRSGQPVKYGAQAERRILAKLDEPPPEGYATWNGSLLAESLGDVHKRQVWRVLEKHGIQLQRRRSWRISTDSEFALKAG